jgi:SdpC family antimicrobial peptide
MKSTTAPWLFGIAFALSLTACGTTSPASNGVVVPANAQPLASINDPRLDGQAIFRGIAFGERGLGELLPEIWHGNSVHDLAPGMLERDSSLATVNKTVSRIERFDPDFFASLSKSMRGGDPLAVEAALVRIGDTLEQVFPTTVEREPISNVALKKFIWRNKVLVKNRVVAVDRHVVRNAIINLYKIIFAQDEGALEALFSDETLKSLQQESAIANLTKRLAF